jgi:transposase
VDATDKIVREDKIASEPQALIAWFASLGYGLTRIGLEAGPCCSQSFQPCSASSCGGIDGS